MSRALRRLGVLRPPGRHRFRKRVNVTSRITRVRQFPEPARYAVGVATVYTPPAPVDPWASAGMVMHWSDAE